MSRQLPLGSVVLTRSLHAWAVDGTERARWLLLCLRRHAEGDWGDVDTDDRQANEDAVAHGLRILSSYPVPTELGAGADAHVWIITEADRSSTTLLWPSDY